MAVKLQVIAYVIRVSSIFSTTSRAPYRDVGILERRCAHLGSVNLGITILRSKAKAAFKLCG